MTNEENAETSRADFPIVGIGASAGGVKALQDFFNGVPDDGGAAFVVVIHLDPNHASELSSVLSPYTKMPVRQVDRPLPLAQNQVYVIAPNRQILISDHEISAAEFTEPRGRRAPIDHFLRSMAEQRGEEFAVILSGAGSDGALGVKAVKEAGGIILVQDPNEAEYNSMPRSAIASGCADFVLPAHELGTHLADLLRGKPVRRYKPSPADEEEVFDDEESFDRILTHVRLRTGNDFSDYKRASLMRRIERRMQVVRAADLGDYLNYLREHTEEVQALSADFLISVTRFFRDPFAFEQLAKRAIPDIFAKKGGGDSIRVWVPGCATGEEAYSIAILLLDEASRRPNHPDIQVFATDLDAKALAVAREGLYPRTVSVDVSEEHLRRFFVPEGDDYRIKREVRDLVVFAQHNVVKDPPFSRVDLISCRHLLIYMNRDLQQKACSTFHYSLLLDGYLFLGSSETAEQPDGAFRMVDRGARIFQSLGRRAGEHLPYPKLLPNLSLREPSSAQMPHRKGMIPDPHQQHQLAIDEVAPPSILVDDLHRILHLSEKAGNYLLHPAGIPTLDITDLVRPELGTELRVMLHRAFDEAQTGISLPIPVQFDAAMRYVCLHVSPVDKPGAPKRALIVFIEGGPAALPVERASGETTAAGDAAALQEELVATRANLKLSRQQFEAATENLRAANEELQSVNEEYRSTAEELETSREELQSMNEELQTLNTELKLKLEAVSRGRDDLQNLMIATDVGILFLDRDLKIKRFTPSVRELFNIDSNDEGRRIGDFTTRLDYPEFEKDARCVMDENRQIDKRIRSLEDLWYVMRMRPYRSAEGKTEGVVATFVDITERRRTENRLRETEELLRQDKSPRNDGA